VDEQVDKQVDEQVDDCGMNKVSSRDDWGMIEAMILATIADLVTTLKDDQAGTYNIIKYVDPRLEMDSSPNHDRLCSSALVFVGDTQCDPDISQSFDFGNRYCI
jgi:hypothetical protein